MNNLVGESKQIPKNKDEHVIQNPKIYTDKIYFI